MNKKFEYQVGNNKKSYMKVLTLFLTIFVLYLYLLFHKSIIVYRHTGCGTCQDSRYNIVKYKYYTCVVQFNYKERLTYIDHMNELYIL